MNSTLVPCFVDNTVPRSVVIPISRIAFCPFVRSSYQKVQNDISEEEFREYLMNKRPQYLYFTEHAKDQAHIEFLSFGEKEVTYRVYLGWTYDPVIQTALYSDLYKTMQSKGLFKYRPEGYLATNEKQSA